MADHVKLTGALKAELIARRQEWARDGRLLAGDQWPKGRANRLPPGQRKVETWPVPDLSLQPDVSLGTWFL